MRINYEKPHIVQAIINRLLITKGHCPCVSEGQWSKSTICPCEKMRVNNECHCGLYVKEG